jgi:hypothetical protein
LQLQHYSTTSNHSRLKKSPLKCNKYITPPNKPSNSPQLLYSGERPAERKPAAGAVHNKAAAVDEEDIAAGILVDILAAEEGTIAEDTEGILVDLQKDLLAGHHIQEEDRQGEYTLPVCPVDCNTDQQLPSEVKIILWGVLQ